jgi:dTDP-4-amino-4,6-dideoxygalactose transaminase
MIPLTVPALGDDETRAVERVLRSGMLVQGKEVQAFEAALAAETGRKHAIAVANGTAALELALTALGIGRGDEVLVPSLTWPSPAHAVLSVGALPVLVDVDPHEWNATERAFREAVTPQTRAAIVIEQFGNPARHAAIRAALGSLPIIVDAACSLGSRYQGAPCGSHGLISCSSFHPRKVITTGEGGACFTDDDALATELRVLRNHGQLEPGRFARAAGNQRLTEFQAAIGSVQMAKLHALCSARKALASKYETALPGLRFQRAPEGGDHNRQTMAVLVGEPYQGPFVRDRMIQALSTHGVQAGRLSYALSQLPQFAASAAQAKESGRSLREAEDIAERGLALPLYPSMDPSDVERVARAVNTELSR